MTKQPPTRACFSSACGAGIVGLVLVIGLLMASKPVAATDALGGDLPHDRGNLLGVCLGWTQAHITGLTAAYTDRRNKELQATLRLVGRRAQVIERNFNKASRVLVKRDVEQYSDFLVGYVEGLNQTRREALDVQLAEGAVGIEAIYDEVVIRCPI